LGAKVQNLFDKYNTLPIPYYILLGEMDVFAPLAYAASPFGGDAQM